MPYSKEFINGFDFENKPTNFKKQKFDKSKIIEDKDKSCHNCSNCKMIDADKKRGFAYHCDKKNYTFMHYWKQTEAPNCDSFSNNCL